MFLEKQSRVKEQLALLNLSHHSYGLDQQSPVSFWDFELDALVEASLSVPRGNVVNYGAFYGASTSLFGIALRERGEGSVVHSIDIKHGTPFYRNVLRRARLDNVIVHDTKSCDYQHDGSPIALALSDSWHDFRTVLAEFKIVEQNTVSGGIFAIHDCEPDVYDNLIFYQQRYKDKWYDLNKDNYSAVDSADKNLYHQAEASQDFEHGAAIAYILDHYNWELVKYGPQNYPSMESITGPWKRGSVSPVSSLVFLRKNES